MFSSLTHNWRPADRLPPAYNAKEIDFMPYFSAAVLHVVRLRVKAKGKRKTSTAAFESREMRCF
jgi:hypothetical protein